jgi:ATP-dependent Lon protease
MRDFRDAKAMAQTLREALAAKAVYISHSESLELVAKILGCRDWNVLSARIHSEHRPSAVAILPGAGLPLIPLRDIVLFPRMIVPLFVGRAASNLAVEHAMAGDRRFLAVTQRLAADDNPSPDDLYRIGVTAYIFDSTEVGNGNTKLLVKGLERATVVRVVKNQFMMAEIAAIEESRGEEAEAFTLARAALERFQAYINADFASKPYAALPDIREPAMLADTLAPFLPIETGQRQDLLETGDVITRLEKILALMTSTSQAA